MLQKIKQELREIKDGVPGRRFVDHYQRNRNKKSARASLWTTIGYVSVGLILILCGLVLSLPPGVPGFLLWIPGLALLAARIKPFAMLLDRLEVWGQKIRKRYRSKR